MSDDAIQKKDLSICAQAVAVNIASTDHDLTTAFNGIGFARQIYVGGAGDLKVKFLGSTTAVTFTAVPLGFVLTGAITSVVKSGTSATNLIAMA